MAQRKDDFSPGSPTSAFSFLSSSPLKSKTAFETAKKKMSDEILKPKQEDAPQPLISHEPPITHQRKMPTQYPTRDYFFIPSHDLSEEDEAALLAPSAPTLSRKFNE